ncbi:hypothetical protein Q5H91_00790 [Sphingomonas sp. KR1UV-12]|uniref:Secreted protein n=1 Tax=Sphingomonas aurea TaxID=3063994 RepID=A0ABT9EG29_9SPHN|nr:hypothetical protein [Sphingomonas sp. KR1UV-12]MDP1025738.1 hypothetical protein [Sphingomonas sp. KR1UV-12]
MSRARLIPLAALIVAAPIAAAPRDPFAGRVAGPPQRCITISPNLGGTVIDRDTIIYQGNGGRIWRTGPTGTCPSLRPMTTLIVQIYGGQLCENDRFSTIEPGMSIPSPQCRFRPFVPYTRVKTGK